MALVDRNRFRKTYTTLKRSRRYIKTYPDVIAAPKIGLAPWEDAPGNDAPPEETFNPATLSLSGWWRASYSGSPWIPTASAGSSSSNGNLTEATNPPSTGTAVNSLTPANFDGANDRLANSSDLTTYLGGTGVNWTVVALVFIDSRVADAPAYDEAPIICDVGGNWGVHIGTSGFRAYGFDAGAKGSPYVNFSDGTWVVLKARASAGVLAAGVNDGLWSAGDTVSAQIGMAGTVKVGSNYADAVFLDGKILELMVAPSVLTDDNVQDIISYFNSRYALSL